MDASSWDPKIIVVGVDGSTQSRHAAAVAAAMAASMSAALHIVTIVRPPEGWWGVVGSPPTATALGNTLSEARTEILDSIISEIDLDGVDYETVEDIGDPGRMLVDYATSAGADVLIIGKRGAGPIERLLLGSVANHVVHDAQCPVLVVP